MLPVEVSVPITLLRAPISWAKNYFQIYRKIIFPPKECTGGDLVVRLGDIQTRIKKYEILILKNNNDVHRHIQSFNFGEGLPVSIPKGGSGEINLHQYILNCYEKCKYEPKENNFGAQLIIYFVNGAIKKSPKYVIKIA